MELILKDAIPVEPSFDTATNKTDEDLLRAFRKGDEAAFDHLFHRHERALIGYMANLTGSLELARDLCQDAFLKLITKPPLFLRRGSVKPWLFRVARNMAFDRLKRRKQQLSLEPQLNTMPDEQAPPRPRPPTER